jgi:hypothetical protein
MDLITLPRYTGARDMSCHPTQDGIRGTRGALVGGRFAQLDNPAGYWPWVLRPRARAEGGGARVCCFALPSDFATTHSSFPLHARSRLPRFFLLRRGAADAGLVRREVYLTADCPHILRSEARLASGSTSTACLLACWHCFDSGRQIPYPFPGFCPDWR